MMSKDMVMSQRNRRLQAINTGTTQTTVFSVSHIAGTVTTGTSSTVFIATALSNVNTYLGRLVRFKDDTATVALRGIVRYVSVYTVSTQSFTVSPALPATPAIGETFEILSEMPAEGGQFLLLGASMNVDATSSASLLVVNFKLTQPNGQSYFSRISATSGIASHQWFGIPPVLFNTTNGDITLVCTPAAASYNGTYEHNFIWTCLGRSS